MKFIINPPISEEDAYKKHGELVDKMFSGDSIDWSVESELIEIRAIVHMYQAINELESFYPECVIKEK